MLPSIAPSPFAAFSAERDPPVEDQRTIKRKRFARSTLQSSLSVFRLFTRTNARLHSSRQWNFRQRPTRSGRNRRGSSTVELQFFWITLEFSYIPCFICTKEKVNMRKENSMRFCVRRINYRGNPYDVHLYFKVLMNTCRYRVNKCQA